MMLSAVGDLMPTGLGGKTLVKMPANDMNMANAARMAEETAAEDGPVEIVPAEHVLIALRDRVG